MGLGLGDRVGEQAMAVGLILEFDGIGRREYEAVNHALGIDVAGGDWPPGLRYHGAGEKDGGLVVYEVWESREAQETFMSERLGRALEEGGVRVPPVRMEWLELLSSANIA
jgi:hypothetical protein